MGMSRRLIHRDAVVMDSVLVDGRRMGVPARAVHRDRVRMGAI